GDRRAGVRAPDLDPPLAARAALARGAPSASGRERHFVRGGCRLGSLGVRADSGTVRRATAIDRPTRTLLPLCDLLHLGGRARHPDRVGETASRDRNDPERHSDERELAMDAAPVGPPDVAELAVAV